MKFEKTKQTKNRTGKLENSATSLGETDKRKKEKIYGFSML